MNNINISYYYHPEVLNRGNSEGISFIDKERVNIFKLEEMLEHIFSIREDCRSIYEVFEEFSFNPDDTNKEIKTYHLRIFGEGGEIGLFFHLAMSSSIYRSSGIRRILPKKEILRN